MDMARNPMVWRLASWALLVASALTGCGSSSENGGAGDGAIDTSHVADSRTSADGTSDLPVLQPDAVVQPDGITPLDVIVQPDVPVDVAVVDTPADLSLPDTAIDTRVPDAAGTCGTSSDCPDPSKAFCVGGVCTGCSTSLCASRVDGGAAVCATSGTAAGKCVECVADGQCAGNPAKGFCVSNTCTACSAALCAGKVDGGASFICATSGTAAGQCVECIDNTGCTKDLAKGFCVNNACSGCTAAICAARTDGKTVCAASGTSAGQCVECVDSTGCTKDPAKGFCTNNACTGCTAALCAGRTDGKTACATTGTFTGQCVTCTSNAQCSGTTPVCNTTTDTCRACASDSECSAIGPGVCLTDGHCATDAEAIYVGTLGSATCSGSNPGTAQAPVCTAQAGVGLAKSGSKPVVVIRGALTAGSTTISVSAPLTIVGKNGAGLTPADPSADAITITSGEIHLRNLTIQGTATPKTGIGINAGPVGAATVTLHMDTCAVKDNPGGGILLNGAAFDIKNTTITGNGVGTTGSTTWGGIFVQSLSATGTASLNLVTIKNNSSGGTGLACSGAIQGLGVLASGNTPVDITPSCNVTACAAVTTTCGAQSLPQ
jgi:hypothetical protein